MERTRQELMAAWKKGRLEFSQAIHRQRLVAAWSNGRFEFSEALQGDHETLDKETQMDKMIAWKTVQARENIEDGLIAWSKGF